ncbi:hypothetical protein EW146_g6412 [Bondarzewia mesenterica]|uniref:Ribosome assembly protein 3 n=1 Tax=Bondarzewia mesenterica TaxID=1095465 RepID=A0A4S4LNL4_9AGAM|nr:hypothetical protein EW146_g6412 [Bondarzewia mesenterica]
MAPEKPVAPRKRNRKRKRRVASSSSSSDSSDSSSSSSDEDAPTIKAKKHLPTKQVAPDSSTEDSSSSSSSDSDSDAEPVAPTPAPDATPAATRSSRVVAEKWTSPPPSPPPASIPSFMLHGDVSRGALDEHALKERFRKFWMASVADAFRDDLDQIRKEPHLTAPRLSLLIDSLASGTEVFTSSSKADKSNDMNEMDVVLDGND